jgi:hypothetical protein
MAVVLNRVLVLKDRAGLAIAPPGYTLTLSEASQSVKPLPFGLARLAIRPPGSPQAECASP